MSLVLRKVDGGVLLLTLNRPERNNAWTVEMEQEYFEVLAEASADAEVRAIVVTGAGKSFCPGLDMQVLAESGATGKPLTDQPRRPMTFARTVPKPVIAAINGACAGIGMVQACSADLRFAARGAKLATSFARRGLPAENALAWILPRLVGTGVAMDLLLSGRTIQAEEAAALGLVERLCSPETVVAEAVDYAKDLATYCSPRAMGAIKRQVWQDWEDTAEQSRQTALALVEALRSEMKEGSASYIEKRPPAFPGLSVALTEERTTRTVYPA
ncbi:MAG: enoyl-CoA hydratase/isomerase family protein [Acidobacteriota bacterium]|nr:enoyl-CoA hydratase/isomerase family protein [Acidobacteriota bacterium]